MSKNNLNNESLIDRIVERAVGENIKKDLEGSLRGVYKVIKDYSYIHDGDILKTQNMIKEAFFQEDKPLLGEDDAIQVNMKPIIEQIPQDIRNELVEKVLGELAFKVGSGELNK
jgi:trans-2-enoyl-CoA reductase